jgi:hypothetical protein
MAGDKGWWSREVMFRAAVDPSVGRTHAFDGRTWTDALGLRGAWKAQRNAAGKPFCAFAVLASRRKPVICHPWQTPLDVYVSPCFARPGP